MMKTTAGEKSIRFDPNFMKTIGEHLAKVVDGTKRRNVFENALKRAASVVVGAMIARAPVGDPKHHPDKKPLHQTIGFRVRPFADGNYFLIVGAQYPAGSHAHLVEYGHRIVVKYKQGAFSVLTKAGERSKMKTLEELGRKRKRGRAIGSLKHFGPRGQAIGLRTVPKPFMAPAVDSSRTRTHAAMIQSIIQGIKENDG